MKIKFLGSGSGLCSSKENYHSNLFIEKNGTNIAIDCGTHFPMAIEEFGIDVKDINAYYISHLHADHIGGLEWVAFKRYFGLFPFGTSRPWLFGNVEVLEDLWNKCLAGGLESIQGRINNINNYFNVIPIRPNGFFEWAGLHFDLIQTVHVVDDRRIKPSYGLMIKNNKENIFFTGDTQFAPNQIYSYYRQADVIFQDCELMQYPESVHAQYHELCSLDLSIKNKMWLYHYSGNIPEDWQEQGFLGFVAKGQTFDF